MASLADLIACSAAGLGGNGRLLTLEGRAVAALVEGERTTTVVASIGHEGALPEMIATLVAPRPSGLLVLGDPQGHGRLALMLRDGVAVAAVGPGEFDTSASWVLEFHRRRGQHATSQNDEGAARIDPSRTFLVECALDAIARCDATGASLLWCGGAVSWLGDELPPVAACDAGFLLLELARRTDEGPRLELTIGPLDRVVVPISAPAVHPSKPVARRVTRDDANDAWDFFDDPDPAAEAEWADARHVFDRCDGSTTIDQLVDRAMLGRFRTIQAVLALLERGHVRVALAASLAGVAAPAEADDAEGPTTDPRSEATNEATAEATHSPHDDPMADPIDELAALIADLAVAV